MLEDFFTGEPWDESQPINENKIYVALDPNGGANATNASGSDTAIVGFFVSRGRLVVRDFAASAVDSVCFLRVFHFFVPAAPRCAVAISMGMYAGSCAR